MKRSGIWAAIMGGLLCMGVFSWQISAQDGLSLTSGKAEAAEENTGKSKDDPVEDTVKKAWMDIYKASFAPDRPGCTFDYGPKGMRNLYCYLVSNFPYQKLIALSGLEPFVKGPHTATELDLDNTTEFGHYNPKFVVWMKDHLIPADRDDKFKWATEPIYARYLQKTARAYYLAYEIVFSDPELLKREKKRYLENVKARKACCLGFGHYYESFPKDYFGLYLDDDYYVGNILDCAFAFWVRRSIDGTSREFRLGLEKLLTVYDRDFLEDRKKKQTGGQARTRNEPLVIQDRILEKFLGDFIDRVEQHDWELALTFFSPENFQMQTEIGIGRAQYLAEGMGLNYVDNQLIPRPGDNSEFAKLNSIVNLKITAMEKPDSSGYFNVQGLVVLFDGSTRTVRLILRRTQTGGYIIEPALG